MAYVYRVVLLFLFALCSGSSGAYPSVTSSVYSVNTYSCTGTTADAAFSACSSNFVSIANASLGTTWSDCTTSAPTVTPSLSGTTIILYMVMGTCVNSMGYRNTPDTGYRYLSMSVSSSLGCPGGGALSASACVCPAGSTDTGSSCVDPNSAKCQVLSGQTGYATTQGSPIPGASSCSSNGCNSVWSNFLVRYTDKKTGIVNTGGDATFDGSVCTYDASRGAITTPLLGGLPAIAQAGSSSCVGGTTGMVNGVSVCIALDPNANVIQSVKSSTTTASDPSHPASSPSSTTTTSGTICTGSKCATSTTTSVTPVGGGTPTTTTTTADQPQSDFCTQNPNAPACAKSSFSGGSCASAPACTGDAIQCAIAAFSWKSSCAYDDSASVTTQENGYVAGSAITGDQTKGSDINTTVNFSSASFDQTELLGAANGLSDLSVTVMGRTTLLKLSMLNEWFAILGYLLVGVTGVLCMRIVARG